MAGRAAGRQAFLPWTYVRIRLCPSFSVFLYSIVEDRPQPFRPAGLRLHTHMNEGGEGGGGGGGTRGLTQARNGFPN